MRITKSNLLSVLGVFQKAMGDEKIRLKLDYAPIYGGYRIDVYDADGEITNPFGLMRRGPKDMYYTLVFAIDALRFVKYKGWMQV